MTDPLAAVSLSLLSPVSFLKSVLERAIEASGLEGVLGQVYLYNPLSAWTLAVVSMLGVALVLRLIKAFIVKKVRKLTQRTRTPYDDAWVEVLNATAWFFYLAIGALFGVRFLTVVPELQEWIDRGLYILLGIQTVLWVQKALGEVLGAWADKEDSSQVSTAAAAVSFITKLVAWSALVLFVLSQFGVKLTTVVAGLGVGGVAAALAVQKVLGDLFAGLSLYFDRPFDIGDFIIVGDVLGNVTKVGLRTTRIRSLGGEQIIYPNGKLTDEYIRNYRRMEERRIVFHYGIEYGSPASKVRAARDIAQEVIENLEGVRFDRAHFQRYGAYSLDYEVVYYVLSPDYNEYMERQHEINLALYERFEEEGICFAFPTRTLHLPGLEKEGAFGRAGAPHRPAAARQDEPRGRGSDGPHRKGNDPSPHGEQPEAN